MKYIILLVAFFGIASIVHSQTIKASTVNRLLDLVKKQDSIPLYRGEEKTDEFGGTYHVSTLPKMGKLDINIEEYPRQPKPFVLYIEIPFTKTVTTSSLKKELKALIKSKAIKGSWKQESGPQEISLYFVSTDNMGIHLVGNMNEKSTFLKVYNTEGQEE